MMKTASQVINEMKSQSITKAVKRLEKSCIEALPKPPRGFTWAIEAVKTFDGGALEIVMNYTSEHDMGTENGSCTVFIGEDGTFSRSNAEFEEQA